MIKDYFNGKGRTVSSVLKASLLFSTEALLALVNHMKTFYR